MTGEMSLNDRIRMAISAQLHGWNAIAGALTRQQVEEIAEDSANLVCALLDDENPPLTQEQLAKMKPRGGTK